MFLTFTNSSNQQIYLGRAKRIWYLTALRAAKVQASLRIRAVSPEPPLLAHTGSESRGTFRQKARSLAPLNGWACAVKICHDGMLEDPNSLDGAHFISLTSFFILHNSKSYLIHFHRLQNSQQNNPSSIQVPYVNKTNFISAIFLLFFNSNDQSVFPLVLNCFVSYVIHFI